MKVDIFNTNKKYDVLYIDPPWPVKKIVRKCRPNQTANLDYPTMTMDEIYNLPVDTLAKDKSVIFCWTTQAFLPKTFELLSHWGFKYQRTITWDKMNGMCLFGFHNRTEFLVFGYKGKLEMYPKRKTIPTLFQISSKHLKHSEKPAEIRKEVEVFGEDRLEMFARHNISGWDCWGNETPED